MQCVTRDVTTRSPVGAEGSGSNGSRVDGEHFGCELNNRVNGGIPACPRDMLLGSPDVFCQLGVVHKGVAVSLPIVLIAVNAAVNRLVAGTFLVADGVGAVPLHKHLDGPVRKGLVTVVGIVQLVTTRPSAHLALVTSDHIEIDAGKVALVLVIGLVDRRCVAVVGART